MSAAGTAAASTVVLPAVVAVVGLPLAAPQPGLGPGVGGARRRWPRWRRRWSRRGPSSPRGAVGRVPFSARSTSAPARSRLDLRADALSATVAVAVGAGRAVRADLLDRLSGRARRPDPDADPGRRARRRTRYPAYAATVSLFTAAMMTVVHADDLVLLLLGWEVMGACSYLLVGHHSERPAARAAAVKAFLVTRVGDLGVLLAVVLLLAATARPPLPRRARRGAPAPGRRRPAAALLLLAGAVGKSAQFPLHTWLPDAMEGPTPVSALIHAATMVAAGVYLVARMLPLFLAAPGRARRWPP